MNAHGDTKRCAGRVYCHSAAAANGLHRADAVNTGAVRHHGHAERSMRAGASEERGEAIYAPLPVALWVFGVMRWGQAPVSRWSGGHVRTRSSRYGYVLGHPSAGHGAEIG